jgi:GT2 family glycosyltransferase
MDHDNKSLSGPEPLARVRVVIVNFDGGQMTLECLDSVLASHWPSDRLEIILVNNSPDDRMIDVVLTDERYRMVRVLQSGRNLGFAAGSNRGITYHGEFDLLALVNNDAVVEPGWLRTLSGVMQRPPQRLLRARPFDQPAELRDLRRIGAVCPKMLFADRYFVIDLSVEEMREVRRRRRHRNVGLTVEAVRLDGASVEECVVLDERFTLGALRCSDSSVKPGLAAGADGAIRITAETPSGIGVRRAQLSLQSPVELCVTVSTNRESRSIIVGPEPVWVELDVDADPVDVVNNVGSELYRNGFAGDRGFMEIDDGRYDEVAEVFAWCGGAVLMSGEYLKDVGLLDERLFLYYEDVDLAWRGRLRGWSYLYSPETTVRHVHGAAGGPSSEIFGFHTERNRLLVYAKNAPGTEAILVVAAEMFRLIRDSVRGVTKRSDLVGRAVLHRRLRVMVSFLIQIPSVLRSRVGQRVVVSRHEVMAWQVDKWAT